MIPLEAQHGAIAVITNSEHKAQAVADSLPGYAVRWAPPGNSAPDEKDLSRTIHHERLRSAWVAQQKASSWYGWGPSETQVALFSDVTQIVPELGDYTLERPRDYRQWLDYTMIQSGRNVVIGAAYTAMRMEGRTPQQHTVVVEAVLRFRKFTKPEIRDFAEKVGIDVMMNSAGGLPVQYSAGLFDHGVPVVRQWYPDPLQSIPQRIDVLPWDSIRGKELLMFATGAHPTPLTHLVSRVQ